MNKKGELVNKSKILIIELILISGFLIAIKVSHKNILPAFVPSWIHQDPIGKMLRENQDLIDRVITLCESNDDIDAFTTKTWSILEDQIKWAQQYKDLLKEKPELANKVDEKWME